MPTAETVHRSLSPPDDRPPSPHASASVPALDDAAYPHIVNAIITHAAREDAATMRVLRTLSRAARTQVDAMQLEHVVFYTDPTPPVHFEPMADLPRLSFLTPDGVAIPCLYAVARSIQEFKKLEFETVGLRLLAIPPAYAPAPTVGVLDVYDTERPLDDILVNLVADTEMTCVIRALRAPPRRVVVFNSAVVKWWRNICGPRTVVEIYIHPEGYLPGLFSSTIVDYEPAKGTVVFEEIADADREDDYWLWEAAGFAMYFNTAETVVAATDLTFCSEEKWRAVRDRREAWHARMRSGEPKVLANTKFITFSQHMASLSSSELLLTDPGFRRLSSAYGPKMTAEDYWAMREEQARLARFDITMVDESEE